jgi:hypothetical protein
VSAGPWIRHVGLTALVLSTLLLALLAVAPPQMAPAMAAAEDPYAAWRQGRPQDAATELEARARLDGAWSTWYDAGLAAEEAGDPGTAAACLLAAHRRAPARAEPLGQLRRHRLGLGRTWCEALGPLAAAGSGWGAAFLALAGGGCLGLALAGRLARSWAWGGALAVAVVLTGAAAQWRDADAPLAAVLRSSALADGAGACVEQLHPGILVRTVAPASQGRRLVELADGRRGLIAVRDLADGR